MGIWGSWLPLALLHWDPGTKLACLGAMSKSEDSPVHSTSNATLQLLKHVPTDYKSASQALSRALAEKCNASARPHLVKTSFLLAAVLMRMVKSIAMSIVQCSPWTTIKPAWQCLLTATFKTAVQDHAGSASATQGPDFVKVCFPLSLPA